VLACWRLWKVNSFERAQHAPSINLYFITSQARIKVAGNPLFTTNLFSSFPRKRYTKKISELDKEFKIRAASQKLGKEWGNKLGPRDNSAEETFLIARHNCERAKHRYSCFFFGFGFYCALAGKRWSALPAFVIVFSTPHTHDQRDLLLLFLYQLGENPHVIHFTLAPAANTHTPQHSKKLIIKTQ